LSNIRYLTGLKKLESFDLSQNPYFVDPLAGLLQFRYSILSFTWIVVVCTKSPYQTYGISFDFCMGWAADLSFIRSAPSQESRPNYMLLRSELGKSWIIQYLPLAVHMPGVTL
jgi:hypothetical protein